MLQAQIFIEKPVEEVWRFIELEFAKVFKCSPSKLLNQEIKSTARNFNGQEISIEQKVTVFEPNTKITIESINSKDRVFTSYELIADADGTFLSTTEDGHGVSSKARSLNYKLMSLPIISRGSRKRLLKRLETMKYIIEGGPLDTEDVEAVEEDNQE